MFVLCRLEIRLERMLGRSRSIGGQRTTLSATYQYHTNKEVESLGDSTSSILTTKTHHSQLRKKEKLAWPCRAKKISIDKYNTKSHIAEERAHLATAFKALLPEPV